MRLTLPESGRSFLQPAECCSASILAHVLVVWFAVGVTSGGKQIPADEREARVFFLLPPDRVDTRERQTEILQLGRLGGDLVDEMVRYEESAAPIYPKELLAIGAEGSVRAEYVVDTSGQVDTTTIRVMHSDDPRFTESVRTALGGMLFRPAKRAGKVVRQLVQQKFSFKIVPAAELADPI